MSISHLTFIDIETVNAEETPSELFQKRFRKEMDEAYLVASDASPTYRRIEAVKSVFESKAALHAEFGKVVAISIGKWVDDEKKFYIRTLSGINEIELLTQSTKSIERAGGTHLVAHNGIDFDFPFLMRRYIINGLPMPSQLRAYGVKPWDLKLEDTMKMWGGSAWNYKVSLELLCHVLGLESPKKDIEGSDVAELFYKGDEESLKKIADYCAGDVLACANAYCRMKGLPVIENVEYV